jgi:hypothetical protein
MTVRSIILLMAYGTIPLATMSTALPTQYLPIWGGGGGSGYTRACGTGKVLTGLQYRTGLVVDAVGVLCRPVQANGQLGSQTTVGSMVGGGSGTTANLASCPSGQVVTGARIIFGSFVDGIALECSAWSASARTFGSTVVKRFYIGADVEKPGGNTRGNACEASTQPAVGIRGRASALVDAIGFFCDEP